MKNKLQTIVADPVFNGQLTLTTCEETYQPLFRYIPNPAVHLIDSINWGISRIAPSLQALLEKQGMTIKTQHIENDGGMTFTIETAQGFGEIINQLESGEASRTSCLEHCKRVLERALEIVKNDRKEEKNVLAAALGRDETYKVDATEALREVAMAYHTLRALKNHEGTTSA
jgi:hypothetical protein